jgi:hypothetical protein
MAEVSSWSDFLSGAGEVLLEAASDRLRAGINKDSDSEGLNAPVGSTQQTGTYGAGTGLPVAGTSTEWTTQKILLAGGIGLLGLLAVGMVLR